MELNDVMRTTFSARNYTGEPLSDEVLYEILDNARFAPSGGNRQGARVIVVRDQATRDRLSELAEPATKRYIAQIEIGEIPWNPVTPTRVTMKISRSSVHASLGRALRDGFSVLVFVVDLGVVAATDQDLGRIGIISGASIYPAGLERAARRTSGRFRRDDFNHGRRRGGPGSGTCSIFRHSLRFVRSFRSDAR